MTWLDFVIAHEFMLRRCGDTGVAVGKPLRSVRTMQQPLSTMMLLRISHLFKTLYGE